ncbi:MAG: DNA recombination protein RmuC [Holosporaceae bacterium]|jgi:DNA recombination protein RmuC|nr:DNA recombination protein RmuC [Holosporaceae bacterium]
MSAVITLLLAAATFGLAFAAFVQRSRIARLISENNRLQDFERMYMKAATENSALEERCKNLTEKIEFLGKAEQRLAETFKSAGLDALSQNNRLFLELAGKTFEELREKNKSDMALGTKSFEGLVNPVKEALTEVENKLEELEKSRIGAYEALKQQVSDMIVGQNSLRTETGRLVSALRAPNVRARWGEMQLKRVVELAGMTKHCDFEEQASFETEEEGRIRPDMVIYLPGEQKVTVDVKTSLSAYLDALETQDRQAQQKFLEKHAQQIRSRISELAGKKYWSQFEKSPEFTIMFLPGETFLSAALEQDPGLMEFAMQQRVVISTPMILLALLHTIALGWRFLSLDENAREIAKIGQELYKRLGDMNKHICDLGKSMGSAVSNYNQMVGSLESRVMVTARKFDELGIRDERNAAELKPVEKILRLSKVSGASDPYLQ